MGVDGRNYEDPILETRLTLEPGIAALAAVRTSREDLAKLAEQLGDVSDKGLPLGILGSRR